MMKCYKLYDVIYQNGEGIDEWANEGFKIMEETDILVTGIRIKQTFSNWSDVIEAKKHVFIRTEVVKTEQGLEIQFREWAEYKKKYTHPKTIKQCKTSDFNLQIGEEYREKHVSMKEIFNYKDGELAARWFAERGLGIYPR